MSWQEELGATDSTLSGATGGLLESLARVSIVAPPVANFGTFVPIAFHSSVADRRLAPASPSRAGSALYLFTL